MHYIEDRYNLIQNWNISGERKNNKKRFVAELLVGAAIGFAAGLLLDVTCRLSLSYIFQQRHLPLFSVWHHSVCV